MNTIKSLKTVCAVTLLIAVARGCHEDEATPSIQPRPSHDDYQALMIGPDHPYAQVPYTLSSLPPRSRDFCIVTQYTANMDAYATIATANHEMYATKKGYGYYRYRGRLSGARFFDPQQDDPIYRFGLFWQKLSAVQSVLDHVNLLTDDHECRWVMWVDADVLFTNFSRDLEEVTAPYSASDVLLSREEANYKQTWINAGVFFVRNTVGGRMFVRDVMAMYTDYKDHELSEQDAMQDFVRSQLDATRCLDGNRTVLPNISLAPQRTFDAFNNLGDTPPAAQWQECDFIAHLAGMKADARLSHMRDLVKALRTCP